MPRLTDEEKLQKAKDAQAKLEQKIKDRAAAKAKREDRAKTREANKDKRVRRAAVKLRTMLADNTYRTGDDKIGALCALIDEAFLYS